MVAPKLMIPPSRRSFAVEKKPPRRNLGDTKVVRMGAPKVMIPPAPKPAVNYRRWMAAGKRAYPGKRHHKASIKRSYRMKTR